MRTLRYAQALAEALDEAPATPAIAAQPADPASPPALHGLTPREVEVLRLIAAGQSNREIAAALSVSPRTIERHIEHLYRKIGAHSKAEATAYAFRHHLV